LTVNSIIRPLSSRIANIELKFIRQIPHRNASDTIDWRELRTRLFATPTHVPGIVYLLLYTIATAAIGFSGYAVALEGKQGRIPYVILGALVAIVIGVIAISIAHGAGSSRSASYRFSTFRRPWHVSRAWGLMAARSAPPSSLTAQCIRSRTYCDGASIALGSGRRGH
jgi:hypothetical protein